MGGAPPKGVVRLTEDLDVFVEPTLPNARRLRRALVDFGFGSVAPAPEQLALPDKVFMLGRKPWRIDNARSDLNGCAQGGGGGVRFVLTTLHAATVPPQPHRLPPASSKV